MNGQAAIASLFICGCLLGCGGSNDGDSDTASPDGGAPDTGADSDLFGCPDPEDPMVHYQTTDISECPIEELHCSPEQYGFHNACGCGCIDKGALPCNLPPDARVYFIGTDPEQCESADLTCPVGKNAFNNSCGCGCVDQ